MQNLYNSIIENLPFGFAYHKIILNENKEPVDYVFLDVNDNYAKFLGYSKSEIINKNASEIFKGSSKKNDGFDFLSIYNNVAVNNKSLNFKSYSEKNNIWYNVYAYSPKKEYFVTFFYENTEMVLQLRKKEMQNKKYQVISEGLKRILDCDKENDIYIIINEVIAKLVKDSIVLSAKTKDSNKKFKVCVIKSFSKVVLNDFKDILNDKIFEVEFEINEKLKEQCYCSKLVKIDFSFDCYNNNYFSEDKLNLIKNLSTKYSKRIIGITNGKQSHGIVSIYHKDENIDHIQIENFIYFCFLAISRINTLNTLISSEEKFRIYVESSPISILVTEKNGDIVFSNKAACELIEVNADNIVNKSIVDFVDDENIDRVYEGFDILEKENVCKIEVRIVNKYNKMLDILFEASKVNEEYYIIFFTDITEIKSMERDIIKAKNKAVSASEAKNQFLANMSHEIRTPMNGINGFLTLLEMSDLDNKQKEIVDCIKISSNNLLNVINDILDITNIEAGRMKIKESEFNIRSCIENLVTSFFSKLNDGVELFILIKSSVPDFVYGDCEKIKQVFSNIISNAVKFTKEGIIYIEVLVNNINDEDIELIISVKDTGIGIKSEDFSKLFKPFSQVDCSNTRHYGGTGLGLSISKRIIEMMGGKISFESKWGTGSKFFIEFKLKRVLIYEKNKVKSDVKKKIVINLLIKNTFLKKIIKYYLKELGYKVYTFYNLDNLIKEIVNFEKQNINSLIISEYREYHIEDDNLFKMLKNILGGYLPLIYVMNREDMINSRVRNVNCNLYPPYKRDDLVQILNLYDEELKTLDCSIINNKYEIDINHDLKILIVEDDTLSRLYFTRILDIYNVNYDYAENGLEALAMYVNKKYDIVFMDLQMPVMDGYEATKKIRELEGDKKNTYIVAVTANVMEENVERCKSIGMDDYIKKPVTVETILQKLKINK